MENVKTDHECDCGGACGDDCKCRETNDLKNNTEVSRDIVADIERFVKCASETILPYNELAYQTIINIVELTVLRETSTNRIVAQSNVTRQPSSDVMAIMDEVEAEINGNE